MQYLKHCLNPKVIAGLILVAAAIWVFALDAFAAALPVLAIAVCPLSMLAMVLLMRDSAQDTGPGSVTAEPSPQARSWSGDTQGAEITALHAQVAELQARLAAGHDRPTRSMSRPTRLLSVRDADR